MPVAMRLFAVSISAIRPSPVSRRRAGRRGELLAFGFDPEPIKGRQICQGSAERTAIRFVGQLRQPLHPECHPRLELGVFVRGDALDLGRRERVCPDAGDEPGSVLGGVPPRR